MARSKADQTQTATGAEEIDAPAEAAQPKAEIGQEPPVIAENSGDLPVEPPPAATEPAPQEYNPADPWSHPPAPETANESPGAAPEAESDPPSPPIAAAIASPAVEAPPRPRGGFLPMLAGGVIAAALGFASSWWLQRGAGADSAAEIAALRQAVAANEARIDALPAAPDLTPLREEIAAIRADLVAQTDGLAPALASLTDRIDALERAPAADGGLAETAIAAWRQDIEELRAAIALQGEDMAAEFGEASARIDDLAAGLTAIEDGAARSAVAAERSAALLRIQAALDSGAPFADALAGLDAPPPALGALAETGAPTLSGLREAFPAAARAALGAARAEGVSGEDGGAVMGFLRSQFQVRSTTPREGDAPDAVLSRAEAALAAGDLDGALAGVATLPEVVRGAMGDWLAQAAARQDALAALAALAPPAEE